MSKQPDLTTTDGVLKWANNDGVIHCLAPGCESPRCVSDRAAAAKIARAMRIAAIVKEGAREQNFGLDSYECQQILLQRKKHE